MGRRLFPTGSVGRAGSSTAWRLSAAAEGARWRVADVRLRKIDSLATACRPRPAALRPKAAFSEASVAADGILGALVGGDYVLDESAARRSVNVRKRMPSRGVRMRQASFRPEGLPGGRSICVTSPVMPAFEP